MVQQRDVTKLMSSWLEQQQKLWQDWMNTVQQAGGGAGGLQPWTGALQGWKEAVEQTVQTQKEATRAWAEQVNQVEGAPEELKRWATEGVKAMEAWSDAQHKLWEQWFELMNQSGAGRVGTEQTSQLMAGWEQMAAQMQELQQQWTAAFSAAPPASKGGAGSRKK